MSVWMSDHNSKTFRSICLTFWLWNSGDPRKFSKPDFEILSWVGQLLHGEIAKILIYNQARVNGASNYENPGQQEKGHYGKCGQNSMHVRDNLFFS